MAAGSLVAHDQARSLKIIYINLEISAFLIGFLMPDWVYEQPLLTFHRTHLSFLCLYNNMLSALFQFAL